MSEKTPAEEKMAELIVEALNLEDISADEIGAEDLLFGDSIGLDSIDALEIAMAIAKEYGVQLKAEDENTRAVFQTVRSLTAYVEANGQAA
ncbi:MAG: phosphopantetheine-binding protein [Pseudomonadota bacterium]